MGLAIAGTLLAGCSSEEPAQPQKPMVAGAGAAGAAPLPTVANPTNDSERLQNGRANDQKVLNDANAAVKGVFGGH